MADALLGGIIINEILIDPNSTTANYDTNQDGTAADNDEFVELLNTSNVAVDIGGLQLWDLGAGNWFTFPAGTMLEPGAHAMVMVGSEGTPLTGGINDLFFYAGRGSPLINQGGDNIVVYDPGNDEYIQAVYNGDAFDNPVASYTGFSATAALVGAGEDFGSDIDGFSIQREPDGADVFNNAATPTPGTQNICFTGGTVFETKDGPQPIERLRVGQMLLTRDNDFVPIKWIWARTRTAAELNADERLRPIVIRKNALGNGVPNADLSVSRHHRILVASKIAMRMFGQPEVLVPAKDLLGLDGVDVASGDEAVTYYHILLEGHQLLYAAGTPAESLYLGDEALKVLSPDARAELCAIFGVTDAALGNMATPPIRPFAEGRRARQLAARHAKNAKPLLDSVGGTQAM
ncbi:Hint domain-containing protein [Yoonia maritima]|uniref:Hint domain-containing protein n=1 Tax=Yoonia maritima TaxID=1435347 RepID=UPI003736AEE7